MRNGVKVLLLTIIVMLLIFGCKVSDRTIDKYSKIWNSVQLEMDGKSVVVYAEGDLLVLKQWDYK